MTKDFLGFLPRNHQRIYLDSLELYQSQFISNASFVIPKCIEVHLEKAKSYRIN